jgi:hypothetical protein
VIAGGFLARRSIVENQRFRFFNARKREVMRLHFVFEILGRA